MAESTRDDTKPGEASEMSETPPAEKLAPKGEYKMLALLLIIGLALFIDSLRSPGLFQGVSSGPGSIPQLVAGALVLMVLALAVQGIRRGYREGSLRECAHYLFDKDVVILLISVSIYGLVVETLHFVPATFLFLVSTMFLFDRRQLLLKIAVSAGTVGALHLIFSQLFQVVLP